MVSFGAILVALAGMSCQGNIKETRAAIFSGPCGHEVLSVWFRWAEQ